MKCTYNYKGKQFQSIQQLDDFLLEKQIYESKYGDLVFSMTERQLSAQNRIDSINKEAEELNKKYAEAKKNASFIDSEEILKMTRPYVGVSEFLMDQRNDEGKLWIPTFTTEYWAKQYLNWSQGIYSEDEKEAFFDGDDSKVQPVELGNQGDWRKADGSLKDDFGTVEQNNFRKIMEDKWKHQAKYGDDIHAIMQSYFARIGEDSDGNPKYRYELWEGNQGAMHLAKSVKYMRNKGIITDEMTDAKINSILEIARNLRDQLQSQYGKKCIFYPEITVSAKLNHEYEGRDDLSVLGRLDLLVIDENGIPHIMDYKTSPKDYDHFAEAKKLTFTYQLSTYERMLRRHGFNTTATSLNIIPLKLNNFRKENGKWTYDNVVPGGNLLESITDRANKDYIANNLDEYIEAPLLLDGDSSKITENVTDLMKTCFPEHGNVATDEQIKKMIDGQGGFHENKEAGSLEFKPKGWTKTISVKQKEGAEAELFNKVKKFFTGQRERSLKRTQEIKRALKQAQAEDTRQIQLPNSMSDWTKTRLSKYCSKSWEVMEGHAQDIAEQFGMIFLYNKANDLVEVVKISSADLSFQHSWGKGRQNIIGAKEADLGENSKSDSLIIKATNGNIELMEAMAVLNNIQFNKSIQLGNISVLNPVFGQGAETNSNKELLYNWRKLRKTFNIDGEDQFKQDGTIKLLSLAERAYLEYADIMDRVNDRWQAQEFSKFKPAMTELQSSLQPNNVEESLEALNQLKTKLEKDFGMNKDILTRGENKGKSIYSEVQNYDQQYTKQMYQMTLRAIAELNGFDIRQETKAHSSFLDSLNILENGMSGNMIDNPGNFGNRLLNQVTQLALDGYQNTRDMSIKRLNALSEKVRELKRGENYGVISEYGFGNQASLYNDMTYYDTDGDFKFKNPWKDNSLPEHKKEFLKWTLTEIAKNKHPDWTPEVIKDKIEANDPDFFQVPLIRADAASKINADGWLGWLKSKVRPLISKDNGTTFKERIQNTLKDIQSKYLSDEIDQQQSIDGEVFKVINTMDQGSGPGRLDLIKHLQGKYGSNCFETDIEKILGAHMMAYATQQAMEDRMPLIKAAYISLAVMGNNQGVDYSSDEKYIKEYVQNKINKLAIDNPQLRHLKGATGMLQKSASWMALAFSPLQMSYQSLEGVWKAAKLVITKPDGKETFSFSNMRKAMGIVYKELFNYSETNSVIEGCNALYGINDMDAASFAQNNSTNKHGLFNFFDRIAYYWSSRPDFYNRMSIFTAQMLEDGSYEAHSVDANGNLIYNIKKDKRFEALFNKPKGSPEYNKAKALFLATAQQLVRENARNADGSLYTIDLDNPNLPKAYSNKESESMKAIGDTMYGYYDSSKKSLWQSTFLGGLMMQMQTYWSGKKNQYLAPGGIKAQGKWVQMISPNGKKCYYSKNENGDIDNSSMPVEEGDPRASEIPFMQWKGRFEEGAFITLYDVLKRTIGHKGNLKAAWKEKLDGTDEDLQKLYKQNIKLIVSDLLGMLLIGSLLGGLLEDLADEEIKKAKKSAQIGDAMAATALNLIAKTVKNSALDFNMINSLFGFVGDWNPFSVSYAANQLSNGWSFITGDKNWEQTLCSAFSAARQMRPILNCINQSLQED